VPQAGASLCRNIKEAVSSIIDHGLPCSRETILQGKKEETRSGAEKTRGLRGTEEKKKRRIPNPIICSSKVI
jgi:hypothetical protein